MGVKRKGDGEKQQVRGAHCCDKDDTMASENWHGNQLVVMAIV